MISMSIQHKFKTMKEAKAHIKKDEITAFNPYDNFYYNIKIAWRPRLKWDDEE